jgi:hypothetical protein
MCKIYNANAAHGAAQTKWPWCSSAPQIVSRFKELELPVWRESNELRRFIAGYLELLPVRKAPGALDREAFFRSLLELRS